MQNLKYYLLLIIVGIGLQTNATIKQIRWGSSGDPLNGLTITWSNNGSLDSIKWGYDTSLKEGSFVAEKRAGYSSRFSFFKYVFPKLKSNANIYYQLYDSDAETWTQRKTYLTAPPLNTNTFSFCALGDSRSNVSTIWKRVSELAHAKKAAFTVFNGDVTDEGNSASEYDDWFQYGATYLENNLVYHAQGNHDEAGAQYYQNIFDLPKTGNTNLYYAVKYGNAIFITLDSQNPDNQTQLSWLQKTLKEAANDPKILWKIISFHKPLFNIGGHANKMNAYRRTWWKAFDDYGVDLILNGHDHNYQRTKPINLSVSSSSPVDKYGGQKGEGRCQIICGGAGATLYDQTSSDDAWAVNTFKKVFHYVYFEVEDCKIIVTAHHSDGSVLETFTLDKTGTGPCISTDVAENLSEKFNPISIAPNPVEDHFTLHYNSPTTGDGVVNIYDMLGKTILSEKINKAANEMEFHYDLSGKEKGIYTISVTIGKQRDNAIIVLK